MICDLLGSVAIISRGDKGVKQLSEECHETINLGSASAAFSYIRAWEEGRIYGTMSQNPQKKPERLQTLALYLHKVVELDKDHELIGKLRGKNRTFQYPPN